MNHSSVIEVVIEMAWSNFLKMKNVLCKKSLKLALEMFLVQCRVLSILWYSMKS